VSSLETPGEYSPAFFSPVPITVNCGAGQGAGAKLQHKIQTGKKANLCFSPFLNARLNLATVGYQATDLPYSFLTYLMSIPYPLKLRSI
jgi:hypothetical protein